MILDVFAGDAFSMIDLTTAINSAPYKPGRLGEIGLFTQKGVVTPTIAVESQDDSLLLIQSQPRGSVQNFNNRTRRKMRTFQIPWLPLEDTVMASDIVGVRQFGSDSAEDTPTRRVNDLLERMRRNHEVTHEFLRCGAIQGVVADSDASGTTLVNLFTEFGVEEASVDFDLGTPTTDIRTKVLTVADLVEDALGADGYDHIHCVAGREWFRKFIAHNEVKYAYQYYNEGEMLRNDVRKGFEFAGVIFEEYRGRVGKKPFIPTNVARFFPVGAGPEVFKMFFAPADTLDAVGTEGLPFYAQQVPLDRNVGIRIHTQSSPLPICMKPRVLVKGTTST